MKIWLDDIRPAPKDGSNWICCHSVAEAKTAIIYSELYCRKRPQDAIRLDAHVDLIDCDHDLGDFACEGGDGIELLKWLEYTERNYPIRIHTMNPVGRENMRSVIRRNNWMEVF